MADYAKSKASSSAPLQISASDKAAMKRNATGGSSTNHGQKGNEIDAMMAESQAKIDGIKGSSSSHMAEIAQQKLEAKSTSGKSAALAKSTEVKEILQNECLAHCLARSQAN